MIKKNPHTKDTQPMAREPTHGSRATHPQPRGPTDPQPMVRVKLEGAFPPTSPYTIPPPSPLRHD